MATPSVLVLALQALGDPILAASAPLLSWALLPSRVARPLRPPAQTASKPSSVHPSSSVVFVLLSWTRLFHTALWWEYPVASSKEKIQSFSE